MRFFVWSSILMLTAPCKGEIRAHDAVKLIAYAKAIDVMQLDSSLPSQPLEQWLRRGPAHIDKLQWRESDCGIKPDYPEPPGGYPLCVDFVYQRARVAGWGIVVIGTTRRGIVGRPRFRSATASAPSSTGMKFESVAKLSILPAVISKLQSQKP